MTEHDRVRMEKAKNCNRDSKEEVIEAIGGLQSTDDPSLVPLHDELQDRLEELRKQEAVPQPLPVGWWEHNDPDHGPSPMSNQQVEESPPEKMGIVLDFANQQLVINASQEQMKVLAELINILGPNIGTISTIYPQGVTLQKFPILQPPIRTVPTSSRSIAAIRGWKARKKKKKPARRGRTRKRRSKKKDTARYEKARVKHLPK